MRRMDELHLEFPFAGSRMLRDLLTQEGTRIGRRHVVTLRSGWASLDRQTPDHASFTRLPQSAAA